MQRQFEIGEIVETRKQHPCGGKVWEVLRTGADFKIKCQKCQRIVMLDRERFEKSIKNILKKNFNT
jgi:hypothetical protein